MDRSIEEWDGSGSGSGIRVPGRRRASARRYPQCEALESRRLLSKASAAAASSLPAEGYLSPGTGEVAKAQSLMSSAVGPAFQAYESELQGLEQSSGVTRAQFNKLENDIQQLAVAIDSGAEMNETDPQDETKEFIMVQDAADQAFVAGSDSKSAWDQLENELANGLSNAEATPSLVQQTVNAMKAVARAAHVTAAQGQQLTADQQAINTALGAHSTSEFGGSIPRSLVVVYYEGQLNQFVRAR